MANLRNYRTPTVDDNPHVPTWMDRLAQDVAVDTTDLRTRVATIENEAKRTAVRTATASGGGVLVTNLVTNPRLGLTVGAWWANLGTGGAGTAARAVDTGPGGAGDTMFRVTYTTAATNTPSLIADTYPVTAGKFYTLSSYGRLNWAGASTRLTVTWRNAAGVVLESSSIYRPHAANTWERRDITAQAPAGATLAQVRFQVGVVFPPSTAVIETTRLLITEGEVLYAYADGTSDNGYWTGAVHASTTDFGVY